MTSQPHQISPDELPYTWAARLRAAIVTTLVVIFALTALGFMAFLSQLRETEIKPDRRADGIVVLTGGSSRVSDAMELLAAGYGRRLLISGVPRSSAVTLRVRRRMGPLFRPRLETPTTTLIGSNMLFAPLI